MGMSRKSLVLACVCAVTLYLVTLAQQPSMSPTLAPVVVKAVELDPQAREIIIQANRELELARLKKENIILQLRLLLKVPNEFQWDEKAMSFVPPSSPPASDKKPMSPKGEEKPK